MFPFPYLLPYCKGHEYFLLHELLISVATMREPMQSIPDHACASTHCVLHVLPARR